MKAEYKTCNIVYVRGYRILGKLKNDSNCQREKAFRFCIVKLQEGATLEDAIKRTKEEFKCECRIEKEQGKEKNPLYVLRIG